MMGSKFKQATHLFFMSNLYTLTKQILYNKNFVHKVSTGHGIFHLWHHGKG